MRKEAKAIKILKANPKIVHACLPGFEKATLLHIAAWNGFSECARVLIKLGASLEAQDGEYQGTPLHWAVSGLGKGGPLKKRDHTGVARHILKAGAQVNTVNKWNISPLYLAFKSDHRPMIRILRSYGAGSSVDKKS